MGANLQIIFFASTTVLQIILIVAVIKGFRMFQETVNSEKQKNLAMETIDHKDYETKNGEGVGGYTEEKEKQMRDLYKIPEGEELLFVKQVKLGKDGSVVEVNVAADGKAK